jgi:hypothetical protein
MRVLKPTPTVTHLLQQGHTYSKRATPGRAWWHTPLIPALGRQRQVDFLEQGQPGLQNEVRYSQGYTGKPCLGKPKKKKRATPSNSATPWAEHIQTITVCHFYQELCLPLKDLLGICAPKRWSGQAQRHWIRNFPLSMPRPCVSLEEELVFYPLKLLKLCLRNAVSLCHSLRSGGAAQGAHDL